MTIGADKDIFRGDSGAAMPVVDSPVMLARHSGATNETVHLEGLLSLSLSPEILDLQNIQ